MRKSRRWRIGVLILLALGVPVGIYLFWTGSPEAEAVKRIERLGGQVVYDETEPGRPVIHVSFAFASTRKKGLAVLTDRLLGITTQLTDADLKNIAQLKHLQTLDLSGTNVTDAGLEELAEFTQLQTLHLDGTSVTDAGLKELAGLNHLQTLGLAETGVTGAGLKELSGLTELQHLYLNTFCLTDAGLKNLRGFTQLQTLKIKNKRL